MTAAANLDFDSAIDQALEQSEKLDSAIATVKQLVRALSRTVATRTNDLVTVRLVRPEDTLPGVVRALASIQATYHPAARDVGSDVEDRALQWLVVASATAAGRSIDRVLWKVVLSASSGYPVTLHGPEPDESVSCFAEDDVHEAFLRAASHGLVGRKISALHRYALDSVAAAEAASAPGDDVASEGEEPTAAG